MTEPLPRTGAIAFRGAGTAVAGAGDARRRAVPRSAGQRHRARRRSTARSTASSRSSHAARPAAGAARRQGARARRASARAAWGRRFGPYEVHGANIAIDMTDDGRRGHGRDADQRRAWPRRSWQHVFGAPADKQPPLRISAILDNSYRNQLGLDINDLVQGDVGVDVTIVRDARGERRVHVRADLVNAEVDARERRLAQAQGAAERVRVRCRQGRGQLPDRAAQRQAGRRQRGDRGLDGDRRRQQASRSSASPTSRSTSSPASRRTARCGPTASGT